MQLLVQPIVIPRGCTPGEDGRLEFFVVFSFIGCENGKLVPRAAKKLGASALPECLKSASDPWPKYVQNLFDKNLFEVVVQDAQNNELLHTTDIHVDKPADLESANWSIDNAADLWRAFVAPTLVPKTLLAKHAAFQPNAPTPPEDIDPADLMAADTEPWAASDLRPCKRLESIDSRLVVNQVEKFVESANEVTNDFDGLKTYLNGLAGDQSAFLGFVDQRDPEGVLGSLAAAVVANDPKFQHEVLPELQKTGKFDTAVQSLHRLRRDFRLAFSQTEIRRQTRFIQSSRHRGRSGIGDVPLTAAAGGVGTFPVGLNGNAEPEWPEFQKLISLIRQHPGLARRLYLTMRLSIACPPAVKQFTGGKITLHIPPRNPLPDDQFQDGSPFCPVSPGTLCELDRMAAKPEENYFRPQARFPQSFYDPAAGVEEGRNAFRRHHVLSRDLYRVTQEDPSIAMARADHDLTDVRDDETTKHSDSAGHADAPQPSRGGLFSTNAVNIYSRPCNETGNRLTAAQSLQRRLKGDQKALVAFNEHAENYLIAKREQASPLKLAGFHKAAMTMLAEMPALFTAENLMAGYSVFVQPELETPVADDPAWLSLCLRNVELKLTDESYKLSFEEEGFLATSVVVPPKPITGLVTDIDITKRRFTVDRIGMRNEIVEKSLMYEADEQTRFSGVTDADQGLPALRVGDHVLVSAAPKQATHTQTPCSELVIQPVWRAEGDGLTPLIKDGLKDFKSAIRLACRNESLNGAELRPDSQLPLLIAPASTRFLDADGTPIIPPGEVDAHQARSGDSPADFKHFLVEGRPRLFARPLNSAADPKPEDAKEPLFIFSNLGPANALSQFHLGAGEYEEIQLPDASTKPPTDTQNPFDLVSQERMKRFGRSRRDGLRQVRGDVRQIDFVAALSVKQAPNASGSLAVTFGAFEAKYPSKGESKVWKMSKEFPKLPSTTGSDYTIAPVVWKDLIMPDGIDDVIVVVSGEVKINSKDRTLELVGKKMEVVSGNAKASLPVGTLQWDLTIKRVDGGMSLAYYDAAIEKPADVTRFLQPLDTLNQYIEVITASAGKRLAGLGWPQRLLGTMYKDEESGKYKIIFPDGTAPLKSIDLADVKVELRKPAGEPQTGWFDVSAEGEKGDRRTQVHGITLEALHYAGEVVARHKVKDGIQVELSDFSGQRWSIPESYSNHLLHAGNDSSPFRRIAELQTGEWLVAACDLESDPRGLPHPVRIRKEPSEGRVLLADTLLIGEITTSQLPSMTAAVEASSEFLQCPLRTFHGNELEVWHKSQARGKQTIIVSSLSVMLGETLTKAAAPVVAAAAAPAGSIKSASWHASAQPTESPEPLHAMVSELIARWSNWALTTAMPGKADRQPEPPSKPPPFEIAVSRPHLNTLPPDARRKRLLPPLRFDRSYRFCVRRTDMAGNHFYDENVLPKDLQAAAILDSLIEEGSVSGAMRPAMAGASPAASMTNRANRPFRRASTPVAPLIAFEPARQDPTYAAVLAPDVASEPKYRPPAGVADKFRYLSFRGREPLLVLLSDVFDADCNIDDDAYLDLLPPPCDVETVLLHGPFDGRPGDVVAKTIRAHEGYVEDEVLGSLAANGALNYFPDPAANYVRLVVAGAALKPSKSEIVETTLLQKWPHPRWVRLYLQSSPRVQKSYEQGLLRLKQPHLHDSQADSASIALYLPPGVTGIAVLSVGPTSKPPNSNVADDPAPIHDYGAPTRTINLIHATNGAWKRPIWKCLQENTSERSDSGSMLHGELEIDRLTTGSCSAAAYWNEAWDESVPAQHEEARAVVEVDRSGFPVKCHILEGGNFGFGEQGAVLFECAGIVNRNPTLTPIIVAGKLHSFRIECHGYGCNVQYRICVAPAHGHWHCNMRSAKATAQYDEQGCLAITIEDPGYCLPRCVVAHIKADKLPMPALDPIIVGGSVTDVHMTPVKDVRYPGDLHLRIIRRPPFYRIAEGRITAKTVVAGLAEIEVFDGGGWYDAVPICVAHDPAGDGFGAQLQAYLDDFGGVAGVKVLRPGRRYSDETQIHFYTAQEDVPEQVVDLAPDAPPDDTFPFSFTQTLHSRARRVDFVARATSRFRRFLLSEEPTDTATDDYGRDRPQWIRRHVPRYSPPRQLEIAGQRSPAKPIVDYLIPAFQWELTSPSDAPQIDAIDYFADREQGRLTRRCRPVMRVYLRRPWNTSGPEQLAVVLAPAVLNTMLSTETQRLYPQDGGVFNPAATEDVQPGFLREPLQGYAVDMGMRSLVTRLGFDPVWDETAFAPLAPDHFPERRCVNIYDHLSEVDTTGASVTVQRPVWLSLHDVHYDGAKELWYSDIRIDLAVGGKKYPSLPFVRVALAAYQEHGLPGTRVSPVTLCEMYKMYGERTLSVARTGLQNFTIALTGEFDTTRIKKKSGKKPVLPRREVHVSLEARDPAFSPEVVYYSPPETGPDADLVAASGIVFARKLKPSSQGDRYWLQFTIPDDAWAAAQKHRGVATVPTLSIVEYEIFPIAENQGVTEGGGEVVMIDNRRCVRRAVYSGTLQVGPIPNVR